MVREFPSDTVIPLVALSVQPAARMRCTSPLTTKRSVASTVFSAMYQPLVHSFLSAATTVASGQVCCTPFASIYGMFWTVMQVDVSSASTIAARGSMPSFSAAAPMPPSAPVLLDSSVNASPSAFPADSSRPSTRLSWFKAPVSIVSFVMFSPPGTTESCAFSAGISLIASFANTVLDTSFAAPHANEENASVNVRNTASTEERATLFLLRGTAPVPLNFAVSAACFDRSSLW